MRATRLKSARFIFNQSRKAGLVLDDDHFEESKVEISDITHGTQYYEDLHVSPALLNI